MLLVLYYNLSDQTADPKVISDNESTSSTDSREDSFLPIREKQSTDSSTVVRPNLYAKEKQESPVDAWATLTSDPDMLTDENRHQIATIVEAWIKEDGIAILDTVSDAIEDEELKESIIRYGLRTVAEDNPEVAFDYAIQFESGGGFFGMNENPYMYSILRKWVSDGPLEALNKVLTVESTSQKDKYLDDIFRSWILEDIQGMIESIPQFPSEIQDAARARAISQLSSESTDEALILFDDLESDTKRGQAARSIALSWAKEDPEAALNWAQTNPNTESIRTEVTGIILNTLASKDSQKAFDIALDLPLNEEGVGLEASILATMAYTNVDKALELLPRVRAGKTQQAAYLGIGGGLAMQGRTNEAIELGKEMPEEDQMNYYTTVGTTTLTGSMLSGLTGDEPDTDVFETIDSIPNEEARSKVAVQAIVMNKMSNSFSDDEIESLKEYVTEEDMKELEEGLEQLEAIPMPFPIFGP